MNYISKHQLNSFNDYIYTLIIIIFFYKKNPSVYLQKTSVYLSVYSHWQKA